MKHIVMYKLYEAKKSELINFFNEKIDWKLISNMNDWALRYTDDGFDLKITIHVKLPDGYLAYIYSCDENKWFTDSRVIAKLIEAYENHGIYYRLSFGKNEFNMDYYTMHEKFGKLISQRTGYEHRWNYGFLYIKKHFTGTDMDIDEKEWQYNSNRYRNKDN